MLKIMEFNFMIREYLLVSFVQFGAQQVEIVNFEFRCKRFFGFLSRAGIVEIPFLIVTFSKVIYLLLFLF